MLRFSPRHDIAVIHRNTVCVVAEELTLYDLLGLSLASEAGYIVAAEATRKLLCQKSSRESHSSVIRWAIPTSISLCPFPTVSVDRLWNHDQH